MEGDRKSTGELLSGRYLIEGMLGKGGSSNVYYGRHLGLDMAVAIKEVSAKKLGKINASNEALLLKDMKHPALPNIIDIFEEGAYTYIIREYCRGEDIRKNIDHSGPYDFEKCKRIARALSSVLEFMHSQEPALIYRDLKPSNVIIDEDDSIKLIDFGISRKFDQNKKDDTQYMGSRKYAAPEQFGLGQSSPKTDIYSLGMLLYFLYTGEDYIDLEEEDKWLKFRNDKELRLKQAILKAISYKPGDRQESTIEFLEEAFGENGEEEHLGEETEYLYQTQSRPKASKTEEPAYVREPGTIPIREKMQLGFFGMKNSVGVSHIALTAALISARKGFKTLLCDRTEDRGLALLSTFINNEEIGEEVEDKEFRYEKLKVKLYDAEDKLPKLLAEDYDVIVFDFGSGQSSLGDFLRLPYKYLILPSQPYAYNKNSELIWELKQYRDIKYIFNLANSQTGDLIKWLNLNKYPHIKLAYVDYQREEEELHKLADFLNLDHITKKRRGFMGRILK